MELDMPRPAYVQFRRPDLVVADGTVRYNEVWSTELDMRRRVVLAHVQSVDQTSL